MRVFEDVESVRSGHSHVTNQPVSFPIHPILCGMLRRSIGMPSQKDGPPSIKDIHGISGNFFLRIQRRLLQHFLRQSSILGRLAMYQTPVQDQRCQSWPWAINSFSADQLRLQISDPHFDKFPRQQHVCGKMRFKTVVCICSQFLTEVVLWIKEVEMVDSVHVLKSSCSYLRSSRTGFWGIRRGNCISSEQNQPHQPQYQFKRKGSLEEMKTRKKIASFVEDRPRNWSTSTSGLVEPMILSRKFADLFTFVLRNDDIQEFNSKSTWWHLGRIVQIKNTRVWETQYRIWIVYGNSSVESWTWFAQIEDHGKEKYWAKFLAFLIICALPFAWRGDLGANTSGWPLGSSVPTMIAAEPPAQGGIQILGTFAPRLPQSQIDHCIFTNRTTWR